MEAAFIYDCTPNLVLMCALEASRSTGKERDQESGNDYFGARYYASTMGRFLSPDWSAKVEPVPYSKLDDPQSLNLYSYVGNNPLVRVDADGHVAAGSGCRQGAAACGAAIKASNARTDKQISGAIQNARDHPIATAINVVTTVAPVALAIATDGASVAVEAGAEALIETEAPQVTAAIAEEATTSSGISMDTAVEKAAGHVDGNAIMEETGKGTNYQFRSTTTDASGNTVSKMGRFDINPADPHVAADGPHLNLETHMNGVKGPNEHISIDPSTIRPGDHP